MYGQVSRYAKHFFFISAVMLMFSCGGGGCSGCAGCGVAPIPGGFPIAERIPNAAQIRLTEAGIGFIESNINPIVAGFLPGGLDFAVPMTSGSTTGVDYELCPGADCTAHASIESFDLTPTMPNHLNAHPRVVLDSRGPGGTRRAIPVHIEGLCAFGVCAIDTTCQADIDTRRGSRTFVGLSVDIDFANETRAARAGYTRIDVSAADLAPGEDLEDADINIGMCSGVSGAILGALIPIFKSLLIGQLQDQISGVIQDQIQDQLCTTRGETGCPTGTFARPNEMPDSVCRFADADDAECVPILLGTDGRGDLGQAFLGSLSPGAHAPGQFLLASGGDGRAVNNGLSLFFHGGFMSTDRTFTMSPGHNSCVPALPPPAIPTIMQAPTFLANTIPGSTTAPHVSIGFSEQYLNYASYGVFDSGMLCLGVGTRLSQQISTGLFSVLIASLKPLAFPLTNAPISLALRPQSPPVLEIGAGTATEPLLLITLPDLSVDFYVWSTERYVRFMTYTADLSIPVNLAVDSGMIVPSLGDIVATDSSVTNNELLTEDPAALATVIQMVLATAAGMFTSGLPPVSLPDLMGLMITVPDGGIRGVEDAGDEFLGIFANLAVAPPAPLTRMADTSMRADAIELDRAGLSLEHFADAPTPRLQLHLEASGIDAAEYEYSYRVDRGPWSAWTRDYAPVVEDRVFFLQARHVVEARARVVGAAASVDTSPAFTEVIVDALAPDVELTRAGGIVQVVANDIITVSDDLEYRFRKNGGEWTSWENKSTIAVSADDSLDVEVRDEAGNVGAARAALIRGLPDASAEGACNCSAAGASSGNAPFGLVLFIGALGIALSRRRYLRRGAGKLWARSVRSALIFVLPLALGVAGCDCGDSMMPPTPTPDGGGGPMCGMACAAAVPPATNGSLCCMTTNMCVMYDLNTVCMPGYTCTSPDAVTLDGMCRATCSMCTRNPPLDEGQNATYLDMAVSPSGTIALSGYNAGVPPPPGAGRQYGDLVVGDYAMATDTATWEVVDGAPAMPVTNDPDGWRGGVSAAGDDVGRFTSVAFAGADLLVSYYDQTHGSLKLARRSGTTWSLQTVDDVGDSGRYTSLALTSTGAPAIAYMRIEPGTGGRLKASARVAIASSASPSGPTDWTSTEIAMVDMDCRPQFCAMGESCLENGACVRPTTDCATACSMDQVCSMGTCEAALATPFVEDLPIGTGLYSALATTSSGLALIYYDRLNGRLYGAAATGTAWGAPFMIDGWGVTPTSGDTGIGSSIFVDAAGVWHVSYVDGAEETLKYARVEAGAVSLREMIDDGSTDGMARHMDGRHIIGDDSSIVVTAAGEVRVAYQDATSHRLMVATRAMGATTWSIRILDMENFTGYWVEQLLVGTSSYVATFWRNDPARMDRYGVRLLTF